MQVQTFEPITALRGVVHQVRTIETDVRAVRTLLPEPAVLLSVRTAGTAFLHLDGTRVEMPRVCLTGLQRHARVMETAPGSAMQLLAFTPLGASRVFEFDLSSIEGTSIDAASFFAPLEDLQRAVLLRLRPEADQLIRAALEHIAQGERSVRTLAERSHLSLDRFSKRFRAAVGATPSRFLTQRAWRAALARARDGASIGRAAIDGGYFDQAHFNRHTRAFAMTSPTNLLQRSDSCG